MTKTPHNGEPRDRAGMRRYRKPTLMKVGLLRDLTQRTLSQNPSGIVFTQQNSNNPMVHVKF